MVLELLHLPDASLSAICHFLLSPVSVKDILLVSLTCKSFQKAIGECLEEEIRVIQQGHDFLLPASSQSSSHIAAAGTVSQKDDKREGGQRHAVTTNVWWSNGYGKTLSNFFIYSILHTPKIFLLGGDMSYRVFHAFNPTTGRFKRRCSLGFKRSVDGCAVYYRGLLLSMSGVDSPGRVEVYNIFSNTWHYGDCLPQPLIAPAVIVHTKHLLLLGGQHNSTNERSNIVYKLHLIPTSTGDFKMSWEVFPQGLLTGRSHCGVASYGGFIWLAGGISTDQWVTTNSVELYNPITFTSTIGPNMLRHRYSPKLAVIDGCLYAIGGDVEEFVHSVGSIEKFDEQKQSWVFVTFFLEPRRRAHCAIAVFGSKIFIFGGVHGENIWKSWDFYDVRGCYWASQVKHSNEGDGHSTSHSQALSEADRAFLERISLDFDAARTEGMNYTVAVTYPLGLPAEFY
eukprot:gene4022-4397_t